MNIKNGRFGEYLFYKLQLLIEVNRDVYVVLTRWGRIGDSGAHQQTPFNTLQEAKLEFCKIFKQKTTNDWENISVNGFTRKEKKYYLIELKKKTNYTQYLANFDHKNPIVSCQLEKKVKGMMKQFTQCAVYEKKLKSHEIDEGEMPITRLSIDMLKKV